MFSPKSSRSSEILLLQCQLLTSLSSFYLSHNFFLVAKLLYIIHFVCPSVRHSVTLWGKRDCLGSCLRYSDENFSEDICPFNLYIVLSTCLFIGVLDRSYIFTLFVIFSTPFQDRRLIFTGVKWDNILHSQSFIKICILIGVLDRFLNF